MLERLISSVLNRTLGTFIETLDAEQLKINIWISNVKLENLQIKPTIFDSMPAPFIPQHGKVGKIFIGIPILAINTSPRKIEISDVFVLIKPKHFNNWIKRWRSTPSLTSRTIPWRSTRTTSPRRLSWTRSSRG